MHNAMDYQTFYKIGEIIGSYISYATHDSFVQKLADSMHADLLESRLRMGWILTFRLKRKMRKHIQGAPQKMSVSVLKLKSVLEV